MHYDHTPVLLSEVLAYLNPGPGQNFVDATLGGGGYSKPIWERIQPGGKLLGIDLDTKAIEYVSSQLPGSDGWRLVHGNFSEINTIVINHKFPPPDGIVADLGLSSYELDQSGRGMSFQTNEPLDMRFDQAAETSTASWLLQNKSQSELAEIFKTYGEEKYANQIAKKIVFSRQDGQPVKHTTELYDVVVSALPKPVRHKAADSARRIFQALRIAVNHELENLENFLPRAFDILSPGGRLVVVSFHSLEDRLVKQFFQAKAKGCTCPIDFPQCICGREAEGKILTKKPLQAAAEELKQNPRSKPAKLRALLKL